jgi:hypothetical protein
VPLRLHPFLPCALHGAPPDPIPEPHRRAAVLRRLHLCCGSAPKRHALPCPPALAAAASGRTRTTHASSSTTCSWPATTQTWRSAWPASWTPATRSSTPRWWAGAGAGAEFLPALPARAAAAPRRLHSRPAAPAPAHAAAASAPWSRLRHKTALRQDGPCTAAVPCTRLPSPGGCTRAGRGAAGAGLWPTSRPAPPAGRRRRPSGRVAQPLCDGPRGAVRRIQLPPGLHGAGGQDHGAAAAARAALPGVPGGRDEPEPGGLGLGGWGAGGLGVGWG